jgi:transaldolase
MLDEEWGFFIDLELNPSLIQKEIQTKKIEKIENTKKSNEKKPFGKHCLTVIYEDEIWYRRDEEDDSDYKDKTWECSDKKAKAKEAAKESAKESAKEAEKKETILANSGCVDKTSVVIYCLICTSFISYSLFLT